MLVPIWIATIVMAVRLWPHGPAPLSASVPTGGYTTVEAKVLSTRSESCAGTGEDRLPNGDVPATVTCGYAQVELLDGADHGRRLEVIVPPPDFRNGIAPGTKVQLARYPADAADPQASGTDATVGMLPNTDDYISLFEANVNALLAAHERK